MYPSDLTDEQWEVLRPLLCKRRSELPGPGRPPREDVRQEVNGILYLVKTGCQWRMLPTEFGAWSKVYARFRRWRLAGVWSEVLQALREAERQRQGKDATPSVAIIDSQSVKTTLEGGSVVSTPARKSKDESAISP